MQTVLRAAGPRSPKPTDRDPASVPPTLTEGGMLTGHESCRVPSCRSTLNQNTAKKPGMAGDGKVLCTPCRGRLETNLLSLPALYSDCTRGAEPEVVRVIRKVARKSAATGTMNAAAAEVRAAIRTVLASWSGLVAEERQLRSPARDVPALARFLCRHVEWLVHHPAAGDLADEIQQLSRVARSVADPKSIRRVHIGDCPDVRCDGNLVAQIRTHGDPLPSEIICTVSAAHTWPVTWWTKLARQMRTQREVG